MPTRLVDILEGKRLQPTLEKGLDDNPHGHSGEPGQPCKGVTVQNLDSITAGLSLGCSSHAKTHRKADTSLLASLPRVWKACGLEGSSSGAASKKLLSRITQVGQPDLYGRGHLTGLGGCLLSSRVCPLTLLRGAPSLSLFSLRIPFMWGSG